MNAQNNPEFLNLQRGAKGIEPNQSEVTLGEGDKSELSLQTLLQTDKLLNLGNLAAAMAHEFNNQLTPILGYTTLLKSTIELNEFNTEIFQSIEESINRISNMTRQMLIFAGKNRSERVLVDVNSLIQNSQELLNLCVTKRIRLIPDLTNNLPRFEGNPQQIQQVLLTLVTNSVEAIGSSEGEIVLSTHMGHYSQHDLVSPFLKIQVPSGDYVRIRIRDNGAGIPTPLLPRIFQPFFTTKPTALGLGLPTAVAIMNQHQGSIKVQSTPHVETIFDLYFPIQS